MSLALAYRLRSNGYLMIFLSIGRFDFNLVHLSSKMDQNAKSFETHSNMEKNASAKIGTNSIHQTGCCQLSNHARPGIFVNKRQLFNDRIVVYYLILLWQLI